MASTPGKHPRDATRTVPHKKVAPKSSRQRRKELDVNRLSKREQEKAKREKKLAAARAKALKDKVLVNKTLLRPTPSYNISNFRERGYYVDKPFSCRECGKAEVWTATQQKWWYEVAKGDVWTTASRCLPCRRRIRAQKEAAQKVQLENRADRATRPRLLKSSQLSSRKQA